MLQRSLASAAALHVAPLLASCTNIVLGSQLPCSSSSSSSSSSSAGTSPWRSSSSSSSCSSSDGAHAGNSRSISTSSSSCGNWQAGPSRRRGFKGGVWDVQQQLQQQSKRGNEPYFNPEDGPKAYEYWSDLWRAPEPRRKRQPPTQMPLYLEKQQQDQLCAAAVAAGVPEELVYGDMSSNRLPRLITAVYAHRLLAADACKYQFDPPPPSERRGIPADPADLTERINMLLDLERMVPGLDVVRAMRVTGFELLSFPPATVSAAIKSLGEQLAAAGVVGAEPGLLFTASPRVCLYSKEDMVNRVKALSQIFAQSLGASSAGLSELLAHPFRAQLLARSSRVVQQHARALAQRYGTDGAARLATKLPQLLRVQPKTLDLKRAVLAKGLGLGLAEGLKVADTLVRREPRLLTHAPGVLEQRMQGLRELLALKGDQLGGVLLRQPSLLHKSTETLSAKLSHLQELLQTSPDQAVTIVTRIPKLLCRSTEGLSRQLVCLQQVPASSVLAPASSKAPQVCLQRPVLLNVGSLAQRLQLLEDLAGTSPAWRASVAELVAGEDMQALADVLAHREMRGRLGWVLQQQRDNQQQQQQQQGQDQAARDILQLLAMPAAEFDQQWNGFLAWMQEQQAAARQQSQGSG